MLGTISLLVRCDDFNPVNSTERSVEQVAHNTDTVVGICDESDVSLEFLCLLIKIEVLDDFTKLIVIAPVVSEPHVH